MRDSPIVNNDSPLPEEAELVHQAQSGDVEAFAQLYDAYIQRIYRYIYFRVSDDMTTEDLTAQVFLKACENLDRYKTDRSPFIAWLYTIARNLVIDYYRTRKKMLNFEEIVHLADSGPAPEEEVQGRFELQAMRDALQFLTADQQQVLILRFIAGLRTREIARIMEKREGTVRVLQMRALQTLSKYMEAKELI